MPQNKKGPEGPKLFKPSEGARYTHPSTHQTAKTFEEPEALLRLPVVCELVGLGESTIRRLRREGKFPKPFPGGGPLRFRAGDIKAYLDNR